MSAGWHCISPKTRVNVVSSSVRLAKYRLCVPVRRVCCHNRSVGLNSGE